MICAVYKSSRKADSYLFIPKRDDFSQVPEPLLQTFGTPQLVMMLQLDGKRQLAFADEGKVREQLQEKGYYLQLPPPVESLLEQHRKEQGIQ